MGKCPGIKCILYFSHSYNFYMNSWTIDPNYKIEPPYKRPLWARTHKAFFMRLNLGETWGQHKMQVRVRHTSHAPSYVLDWNVCCDACNNLCYATPCTGWKIPLIYTAYTHKHRYRHGFQCTTHTHMASIHFPVNHSTVITTEIG